MGNLFKGLDWLKFKVLTNAPTKQNILYAAPNKDVPSYSENDNKKVVLVFC